MLLHRWGSYCLVNPFALAPAFLDERFLFVHLAAPFLYRLLVLCVIESYQVAQRNYSYVYPLTLQASADPCYPGINT
jgi:hypothetical protein